MTKAENKIITNAIFKALQLYGDYPEALIAITIINTAFITMKANKKQ